MHTRTCTRRLARGQFSGTLQIGTVMRVQGAFGYLIRTTWVMSNFRQCRREIFGCQMNGRMRPEPRTVPPTGKVPLSNSPVSATSDSLRRPFPPEVFRSHNILAIELLSACCRAKCTLTVYSCVYTSLHVHIWPLHELGCIEIWQFTCTCHQCASCTE